MSLSSLWPDGVESRLNKCPRTGVKALTLEGLVTLEGEWVDPGLADHQRGSAFTRADACTDAMDDDAWLVCLSVHF